MSGIKEMNNEFLSFAFPFFPARPRKKQRRPPRASVCLLAVCLKDGRKIGIRYFALDPFSTIHLGTSAMRVSKPFYPHMDVRRRTP